MNRTRKHWLSLAEASRQAGRSAGHLRRICKNSWEALGLAEQRHPKGGGKRTWFIHASALDPGGQHSPALSISDADILRRVFSGITALNRSALMRVWALVEAELRTARFPAAQAGFEAGSTAPQGRIERHSGR